MPNKYINVQTKTQTHTHKSESSTLKKSRIPRRTGGTETQTNTMKSMKSKASSPHHSRRNIRQSTSFGNLTDEQSMDLLYRTIDQRNGHLVKRTKSFWKFGKSDDEILAGMALWQHKDLVQTDHEKSKEREREQAATLNRRLRHRSLENQTISTNSSETLVNGQNGMHNDFSSFDDAPLVYPRTKSKIDERVAMQRDDENIYGRTDRMSNRSQPAPVAVSRAKLVHQYEMEMEMANEKNEKYNQKKQSKKEPQSQKSRSKSSSKSAANNNKSQAQQVIKTIEYYDTSDMDSTMKKQSRKHDYNRDFDEPPLIINTNSLRRSTAENQFFDDDSVTDVIMKTVKRQEILKQYYSSGTDTERNSASSSDPYDCIVVDDHLVRRENQKNKNKNGQNGQNGKMEFKTFRGDGGDSQAVELEELNTSRPGTLLPRTKLTKNTSVHRSNGCFSDTDAIMKSKSMDRRERRTGRQPTTNGNSKADNKRSTEYQNVNEAKAYGPWYDLWGQDNSVRLA